MAPTSPILLALLLAASPLGGQSVSLRAVRSLPLEEDLAKLLAISQDPEEAAAEEEVAEEGAAEEAAVEGAEGEEGAEEEGTETEKAEEGPLLSPPFELGLCELVETAAPELAENEECLCDEGHFWNWQTKKCSRRGAFGYECGFFPVELHPVVCNLGFTCKSVNTSEDHHYVAHGKYKAVSGSHPAQCRRCTPDDNCPKAYPECEKQVHLAGDICVHVRVGKPGPIYEEKEEETEHEEVAEEGEHDEEAAPEDGEEGAEGEEGEAAEEGAEGEAAAEAEGESLVQLKRRLRRHSALQRGTNRAHRRHHRHRHHGKATVAATWWPFSTEEEAAAEAPNVESPKESSHDGSWWPWSWGQSDEEPQHVKDHEEEHEEEHEELDEDSLEHGANHTEPPVHVLFSKGSHCISVDRAKQRLGVSHVTAFDARSAQELIGWAEHEALQVACRNAREAEPEQEPEDEGSDEEAAAEAAAEEAVEAAEAAAEEEEAAAEGEGEAAAEEASE